MTQCGVGTGKLVCRSVGQGERVENRVQVGRGMGQRDRVAGLAGGAGLAVCAGRMRCVVSGIACAVMSRMHRLSSL